MSNTVTAEPRNPHAVKSPWYILRIDSRCELVRRSGPHGIWLPPAVRAVRRAGYGIYVPMQTIERQHRRTKAWRVYTRPLPAFTGYAFVEMVSGDWLTLRNCTGVIDVLGNDGAPFPVLPRFVEALMLAQMSMAWDDTRAARLWRREIGRTERETLAMRFPSGAAVRVLDGPFSRMTGRVTGIGANGHIEALVRMLGRLVPCSLPVGQLEIAA